MSRRSTTKQSVWSVWLPLGIGAVIFLGITLVGNILIIGSKLERLHPVFEWAFYGCIILALLWFVAVPIIRVLAAPVVALEDIETGAFKSDYKALRRVAYQLADSDALPPDIKTKLAGAVGLGSALQGPLAAAISAQKLSATAIIREHAVLTFVSTAISQNGRLDAVSVIITNLRLVRRLVGHFGYRPPFFELVRIYGQVFVAAVIADGVNDVDVEGALSRLGLGVLDVIPASRLLIDSAFDGAVNALFTLRVGFVTQRCLLNAGKSFVRSEVRRAANREARQEMGNVLREAVPAVPSAMKSLIEKWI
ncbi:MAG: hypothetical protein NT154_33605 [Verrucomicrobia bacterium]|nr:hypothetical protein [Verrucomicrobiota bacterium]